MSETIKAPAWLVSLVEEHFDELQMLWELRESALTDADYRKEDIVGLDEWIECHVDALVLADRAAWPILEAGLGGDRLAALAASLALLRQGPPGAELVMATLATAEGPAVDGIREGICNSNLENVAGQLKEWYETGAALLSVTAAEIFAYHRRLNESSSRLDSYFSDPNP